MIDVHIHVVPPRLPGVGSLSPILDAGAEATATALRREMLAAGITQALAMGSMATADDDPLGIRDTQAVCRLVNGLHAIGVADPRRTEAEHLRRVDAALASRRVRALKGYLGYLHFAPDHPGYRPYYELADRHGVPVVFHTGDTYSAAAKLRYAHPLLVDDVAVDHPGVKFVLAHLGNPWLIEAAEVIYKNLNVWADLSGFVLGPAETFAAPDRQELLHETREALGRAFRYAERPNRFLYGSDWPLVSMKEYGAFVASAVPEVYHGLIFEENARLLFRLSGE